MAKKKKMKVNMIALKHLAKSGLVREDTLNGEEYWVLPTVLITEGVFNEALYLANELAMFPESWDGRPILNQHPVSPSGTPMSANSPGALESQGIGQIFNTEFMTNGRAKLRSESWINKKKCAAIAPEIVTMIENGEDFEVSTGLFVEQDEVAGEFEDEAYDCILHNFRPDHLAFLPGGEGACSWKDGAGAPRLNRKEENEKKEKRFRTLATQMGIETNELSHEEVRSAIHSELRAKFGDINDPDGAAIYLSDVYDDYVIFELSDNTGFRLMKQAYGKTGTDEVNLEGDPVQVVKQITYVSVPVPTNNEKEGKEDGKKEKTKKVKKNKKVLNKSSKKENTMDEKERKKRIDALIANTKATFVEEDRESLVAMSDDMFEKVESPFMQNDEDDESKKTAAAAKKKEEDEAADVEAKKKENEQKLEDEKDKEVKPKTLEQYVKDAPPEVASVLNRAIAQQNAQKNSLVKELVANKRNTFTEDELKEKDIAELTKIAGLVGGVEDYSLQVNDLETNEDSEAVPDMPQINWAEASKTNGRATVTV